MIIFLPWIFKNIVLELINVLFLHLLSFCCIDYEITPKFPPQPKSLWIYSSTSDILPTSSFCTFSHGPRCCHMGTGSLLAWAWLTFGISFTSSQADLCLSFLLACPVAWISHVPLFGFQTLSLYSIFLVSWEREHVKYWNSKYLKKNPLEKSMPTHSSILAWRIPWTDDLVGYSPWGLKELDTTEWLARAQTHTHTQISKNVFRLLALTHMLLLSRFSRVWLCATL